MSSEVFVTSWRRKLKTKHHHSFIYRPERFWTLLKCIFMVFFFFFWELEVDWRNHDRRSVLKHTIFWESNWICTSNERIEHFKTPNTLGIKLNSSLGWENWAVWNTKLVGKQIEIVPWMRQLNISKYQIFCESNWTRTSDERIEH